MFPETVTTVVTFKSIAEDFQERTLRAVAGVLGKLGYVAGLREADGTYMHWGLSRIHGDAATQRALTEAHKGLVSRILRMPMRKLLQDVEESSGSEETQKVAFVEKLHERPAQLLPPAPGAGTVRHLNSVLHALASLVKNRS